MPSWRATAALGRPTIVPSPTLRQTRRRDLPDAAICVQKVDVQCVLQFTLLLALSCVLHRLASRVIHRRESSNNDLANNNLSNRSCLTPQVTVPIHHITPHTPARVPVARCARVCRGRSPQDDVPSPLAFLSLCSLVRLPISTRAEAIAMLVLRSLATAPIMILPQVHLRKPCYDFYFL